MLNAASTAGGGVAPSTGPKSGAARAAAPANISSRSASDALATAGSSNCRTQP